MFSARVGGQSSRQARQAFSSDYQVKRGGIAAVVLLADLRAIRPVLSPASCVMRRCVQRRSPTGIDAERSDVRMKSMTYYLDGRTGTLDL